MYGVMDEQCPFFTCATKTISHMCVHSHFCYRSVSPNFQRQTSRSATSPLDSRHRTQPLDVVCVCVFCRDIFPCCALQPIPVSSPLSLFPVPPALFRCMRPSFRLWTRRLAQLSSPALDPHGRCLNQHLWWWVSAEPLFSCGCILVRDLLIEA